MYSVNGIALDNPGLGSSFAPGSKPISEFVRRAQSLVIPGRDGVVTLPATIDAPVIPLKVFTPTISVETLLALVLPGGTLSKTENPNRVVAFECLSSSYGSDAPADAFVTLAFMLRLNDVYWRDTTDTTSPPVTLTGGVVAAAVFGGLSAPVRDALIRVKGQASGLRVTDAGGSWFEYTQPLPTGSYLRFDSASGRAWTTTTDTWDGGTEVTGLIKNGPGPYPLSIVPTFTNPASRTGQLTVTTSARSGASIQVRGRRAYIV